MTTRREFLWRAPKGLATLALAPELLRAPHGLGELVSTHAPAASRSQTGTGLVSDDRYLTHRLPDRRGQPHPERPLRLLRMLEEFRRRGLLEEVVELPMLDDPMPFIRRHHTPEHVGSVREIEITNDVAELAVGGALGAVDAVARPRDRRRYRRTG